MNRGSEIVTGKRILLADDQEEVRETIKLLLSLDEHTIVEAANGKEALRLFETGSFDLVITDYLMPAMKGDELVERIRQTAPAQPVLMITGSAEKFGGIDAPVDHLLSKPVGFDDLRFAIRITLTEPPRNARPAPKTSGVSPANVP